MDDARCKLCGRGPAARFTIRRHVGMVLVQKFAKVDAVLCRDHALAIGKEYLGRTLVQGWWGVTSFFFNIGAVITDVSALVRASRMPAPGTAGNTPVRPDAQPSNTFGF